MKKQIFSLFLICIALLIGCSKEETFENFFHRTMGKMHKGAKWDSPIKWSSMTQALYIYSGAINDKSISEIYAGEKPAKIIEVKGDKRFWYAVSDVKDVQVKAVKSDGTQEIIEETDKNWHKVEY